MALVLQSTITVLQSHAGLPVFSCVALHRILLFPQISPLTDGNKKYVFFLLHKVFEGQAR